LSKRTKAEALLVVITFIWGSTFVVVKHALSEASPLPWLAIRFSLAGILLLGVLARGRIGRSSLLPGAVLGLFLFGGFAFQTLGQKYTTPSKCAFITGFSVILVPVIMLFYGHRMRAANLAGGVLGLSGIYFLVLPSPYEAVNRGDVYTLVGAVAFALHIVLVGHYNRRFSFRDLVPIQVLGVALLALGALPFDPDRQLHWTLGLAGAFLFTALFSTGFAFSVQNWAQQYTPPAHTALIFALEPVFAALSSRLVMGERLGGKVLLGSALILAGMVISEVWGGTTPSPVEG
jgi:drug/metabolite transporter (DMT)-like permease